MAKISTLPTAEAVKETDKIVLNSDNVTKTATISALTALSGGGGGAQTQGEGYVFSREWSIASNELKATFLSLLPVSVNDGYQYYIGMFTFVCGESYNGGADKKTVSNALNDLMNETANPFSYFSYAGSGFEFGMINSSYSPSYADDPTLIINPLTLWDNTNFPNAGGQGKLKDAVVMGVSMFAAKKVDDSGGGKVPFD